MSVPSWPRVARRDVLRRRLAVQRLTTPGLFRAADVVALLTCVQSQEWAHGFWSLGMRTGTRAVMGTGPEPGTRLDAAAVQAEFDRGDVLRTHILRPTWHYVTPTDLRWILAATSPRVHQRNASAYRQTGLDPTTRERAAEVMLEALRGGVALTRPELAERLAAAGIAASGMRLAHVVMSAELDGLIASGPLRGAQHTYRRLDELLTVSQAQGTDEVQALEDPVSELLARFLAGHGPASLPDFVRWCSLTLTEARSALDRLRERLGDRLVGAEVHDVGDAPTVWWLADAPEPEPATGAAYLLPLYDELTLSYPAVNFEVASGHPHVAGEDLFVGSVIVDRRESAPVNIGLWQRTVRGRRVSVELELATSSSDGERAAARAATEELAEFLGKELT